MTALLIVAAAAAALYQIAVSGRPEGGNDWIGSAAKTVSTAALALAGLAGGAPGLIVLGLALGAAGDFALSRPGKAAFLAGMAAFAAGHLAYALAFLGWMGPGVAAWQIAALITLALLILSTEVWLAPHTADLRAPVRAYALIIGVMAALALLLPAAGLITALGAALFVLSDTLLALRLFVLRAPVAERVLALLVWPAYWGGQALILWGSGALG